jgi:hypothetical protein
MLFGCASRDPLADFADRFSHDPGNLILRAVVIQDGGVPPGLRNSVIGTLSGSAREDYRTLDEILQFPNVSRPLPIRQGLHCGGRNCLNVFLHLSCELVDEVANQHGNIFLPLA